MNAMTMKNRFFGKKSASTVHMLAKCQMQTMESLVQTSRGELEHMEKVAKVYLESNDVPADFDKVILRDTAFLGGKKSHEVQCWPEFAFFDMKSKQRLLSEFWIKKIDWSIADDYIDSIRFTMANSNVSTKFGRRAIGHFCEFDQRITSMELGIRNSRLVRIIFYCDNSDMEYFRIQSGP
mmetsp:Transcript_11712/g.15906  ORF Transcript_11712/g.15906 Transcript_11712/m.15906 type:complete len:180 (-) Transcript_11712:281-820(-)